MEDKIMNAKEAERYSGISKRNLRFYEQQGLIHPDRNPNNEYRDYSAKDIDRLKIIRALRMVDTPLEDVKEYLDGKLTMEDLSKAQEMRLVDKKKEVEASIQICRKLQNKENINSAYIDLLLQKMDSAALKGKFFDQWKEDYKKIASAEAKKSFSFIPDDAITDAREFTMVLFKYATEQNISLVITKEGLEPEFEIDGVEYTAQRVYRKMGPSPFPVMLVLCTAVHPELLESEIGGGRATLMKLFHNWWWIIFCIIPAIFLVKGAESVEEAIIVLIVGFLFLFVLSIQFLVFRNYKE